MKRLYDYNRRCIIIPATFMVLMCLLPVTVSGIEPSEIFRKANQLYRDQLYTEARKNYEHLLTGSGLRNETVYFNLANAYYKENDLGRARVYYEKARILAPRDNDISHNLSILRSRLVDQAEVDESFLYVIYAYVTNFFSIREIAWIFWSSSMLLLLLILLTLNITGNTIFRSIMLYGGLPLWLATSLLFSVQYYNYEHFIQAVAVEDKIDVRSGPDQDFQVLFSIHEGIKLRVTKVSDNNWAMVLLPNGLNGWVPAGSFICINPL